MNTQTSQELKLRHPVKQIHITTAQIDSVVGDRYNDRGVLVRRSSHSGHWLRGLCSTGTHRWEVDQAEILYAEPKIVDGRHPTQIPGALKLWASLVAAADDDDAIG